jgi:hypothetical protein
MFSRRLKNNIKYKQDLTLLEYNIVSLDEWFNILKDKSASL